MKFQNLNLLGTMFLLVLVLLCFGIIDAKDLLENRLTSSRFQKSLEIDLCEQINADIHGDLLGENEKFEYRLSTDSCNKAIIAHFLESTTNGYQVDAFKGEFDNGQLVDIVGLKGPQKFIVDSGILSVRITRISKMATSYHQLFTTDANVTVISDISDRENYGAYHPFPKGDSHKYIFYQAAPSIDGNNGMELLFEGDCEHLFIWKGLTQSDSTELYGGSASTECNETYARDSLPRFAFTRYLTVQTQRPNNCTLYWLPKLYVADNELIAMYPATTGLLSSPEFNGPLDQDNYLVLYNFERENGVETIYFTFFTPIVGDSELTFYEYDSGKITKFTENNQQCHFESNESRVDITYKWHCKELPCETGIVVKYSAKWDLKSENVSSSSDSTDFTSSSTTETENSNTASLITMFLCIFTKFIVLN